MAVASDAVTADESAGMSAVRLVASKAVALVEALAGVSVGNSAVTMAADLVGESVEGLVEGTAGGLVASSVATLAGAMASESVGEKAPASVRKLARVLVAVRD